MSTVRQITTYGSAGLYFRVGGLLFKLDSPIDHLIISALQGTEKQSWKMLNDRLSIIALPQITPVNPPSDGFPQPDL